MKNLEFNSEKVKNEINSEVRKTSSVTEKIIPEEILPLDSIEIPEEIPYSEGYEREMYARNDIDSFLGNKDLTSKSFHDRKEEILSQIQMIGNYRQLLDFLVKEQELDSESTNMPMDEYFSLIKERLSGSQSLELKKYYDEDAEMYIDPERELFEDLKSYFRWKLKT